MLPDHLAFDQTCVSEFKNMFKTEFKKHGSRVIQIFLGYSLYAKLLVKIVIMNIFILSSTTTFAPTNIHRIFLCYNKNSLYYKSYYYRLYI